VTAAKPPEGTTQNGLRGLASGRFWGLKESDRRVSGRADPGCESDEAEQFGTVAPEESLS
jgi:hypothetical protein